MDFFGDPDFRVLQEFCAGGVLFGVFFVLDWAASASVDGRMTLCSFSGHTD